MLELGVGADLLRGIGWVLWWLIAAALVLAFTQPKSKKGKAIAVVLVLMVVFGPMVPGAIRSNELKKRKAVAKAMILERCKRSGEFIHQTVDDVEGVYLLKLRPKEDNTDDQFLLDDPYGRDSNGMRLIESFLRKGLEPGKEDSAAIVKGYHFVVANDVSDGQLYRFTGSWVATRKKVATATRLQEELKKNPDFDVNIYDFKLHKAPPDPLPRYGVTWDDISTREEREYWIAGSSLKVIDLQTNKVIAERIGYMIDWGQGSKAGFRSPWLEAADAACPSYRPKPTSRSNGGGSSDQAGQTYRFVSKVLKPKQ